MTISTADIQTTKPPQIHLYMAEIDASVVSGASYYVYEGAPKKESYIACTSGGVSGDSKTVTFYTFDGNPLTTVEHNFRFPLVTAKLDPSASKPKPVSYKRIWWPAFQLGLGLTKGSPGYAVLFHDKNDNRFAWERIPSADYDIRSTTKYDLSEAFEEPADFSLKDDKSGGWCQML